MKSALMAPIAFVALLWLIKMLETLCNLNFLSFGLYPQTLAGLFGIFSAPLIHSSWTHLLSNTPPLLVLGTLLCYGYPKSSYKAFIWLYLCSGASTWLCARESYHIGASGLTHGLMFFLFTVGILRRDNLSIAFALIAFFLYGSMIWSILPNDPNVSYELHFFGALWGLILAFFLKNTDPKPTAKQYDWETEGDKEDPTIGDAWKSPKS